VLRSAPNGRFLESAPFVADDNRNFATPTVPVPPTLTYKAAAVASTQESTDGGLAGHHVGACSV